MTTQEISKFDRVRKSVGTGAMAVAKLSNGDVRVYPMKERNTEQKVDNFVTALACEPEVEEVIVFKPVSIYKKPVAVPTVEVL